MIPFIKLQGNGNDFILIDEYHGTVVTDENKANFASTQCNRRFGVGADGVLFLSNNQFADIGMRLFQPDGTEAEMCGNGICCIVKYAVDAGYVQIGKVSVNTLSGILDVRTQHTENRHLLITVNMGKPLYDRPSIPTVGEGELINQELHGFTVSAVNTGVPHAVVFTKDLKAVSLLEAATKIRYDPLFPNGTNVDFVEVHSTDEISIRTYERGVEAETLSCGTGSVASASVANRLKKTGDKVLVHTMGGQLHIALENDTAYMEGSAETVFKGEILTK
ncbi:MAG: Diaminopimelate epimerase [Candidatus Argoarchaeum ethanivorans]|uniref:Diaminopimelate epimerase n=1 Tax=Candidatus Argoarchaeum ethanivorans TaxID=2608793 RepID=A0A811T5I8_9EURY|nr:MAG: Diaminopimelate epimerase [Candidatus Argoarchaeum ethanivorans]